MRIKIINCSNPNFWYADKINQEFEAISGVGYTKNQYGAKEGERIIGYVNINDAMEIK